MKLNAVLVIDCTDLQNSTFQSVKAFTDDAEGNAESEATFREWVAQAQDPNDPVSDEDMEIHLENGYYEVGEGRILLVHTT